MLSVDEGTVCIEPVTNRTSKIALRPEAKDKEFIYGHSR